MQDPHHYFHTVYGATELNLYQERDNEKQERAAAKGITIINVPFWWDWNMDRYALFLHFLLSNLSRSLIAKIKERRKDLLTNISVQVPPFTDIPPKNIMEKFDFGNDAWSAKRNDY